MVNWWAEEWSLGSGSSRVSCHVSRTPDGFAVDVFRGEMCVESFLYDSHNEATKVAHALKLHYQSGCGRAKAPDSGRSLA
jgi:hypothetical protein